MKIAVVGAGIFGSTIAFTLAREGHDVHLLEKKDEIMKCASRTNQLRLHKGYHYPRSPETVNELRKSIHFFMNEYESATYSCKEHLYCISSENSLINSSQFLKFCDEEKLSYKILKTHESIKQKSVELIVNCDEKLINYTILRNLIIEKLIDSKVKIHLCKEFQNEQKKDYDFVVIATYARLNDLIDEKQQRNFQFELCEKIFVSPPKKLQNRSIVIMDGPFFCIDSYNNSKLSLLGNVVHAIHESSVGKLPKNASIQKRNFIDIGMCNFRSESGLSHFDKFIESGTKFLNDFEKCDYRGSLLTYRTVLPNVDDTDERPTVLHWENEKEVSIFSGKIDTCVRVAHELAEKIR